LASVLDFYARRMKKEGIVGGQSGAVVVQRTSSDLKLNPHLHVLLLDGVYRELGDQVAFHSLPDLSKGDVGAVLVRLCRRTMRFVAGRGPHDARSSDADPTAPRSTARGRRLPAFPSQPLIMDDPLCASLAGFTLHAATRAGALDALGREALCTYVFRPSVARERALLSPEGLMRISPHRTLADGAVTVDRDALSLLYRLAASVPPPQIGAVSCAGVLARASRLHARIAPTPVAPVW
jgi:hypothetical protein